MGYNAIEITKREILVSVSIIAVMIGIGVLIDGAIMNHYTDKTMKIKHMVEVNSPSEFDYCLRTDVGDVIAEDTLKATSPVSIHDIPGTYMYICKEKQQYTMHTQVHHVSTGKTHTTYTTHYWSWDTVHKDRFYADTLKFLEQVVDISPRETWSTQNCIINESSRVRYVYHTIPTEVNGVLTATTDNGHLTNVEFKRGKTIERLTKQSETHAGVVIFWILWLMLTAGLVFLFYAGEYNWLEKN